MADDRVIAVCEGGPLNGVLLSAPLGEDGKPEPLESRREVVGVLYVPKNQIELKDEHQFRVATRPDGKDVQVPLFGPIEHEQAWLYVPEESA